MPHAEDFTIDTGQKHGDWRDELFRDGFVVLKDVISAENSQKYIQNMFSWLEKFPFGFDRNDSKTWTPDHLPTHMKGGMYHGYSVQHERFMWEARQEPGVIEAFEKLWGTKELLVSFDGMNFTLPSNPRAATEPWPHIDQSPTRLGLQCVQGILNFAPNGPQDGGLMVMKGSHKFKDEFFSAHDVLDRKTWGPADWFGFETSEVKWFEDKGCELLKVCAGVGDLILWDSRTVHYNVLPESDNIRALIYACYTPASFAAPDDLDKKAELFDQRKGTTHWPHANIYPNDEKKLRLGKIDVNERNRPFEEPEMNDIVLKLAGRLPY
ncbi:putative phytanoyl-CoA dioxygenase [Lachnellula arida]|uniref:Putative phytanoyl-CoA dioxygenase n=1 Tax=Lachnellula arida TaxID=1316785 RepID=A0A8T9B877_9HELO|nr:putative phytanoyl-CoA dioxygenase [Lachnellula arida]